jgi:heterodisulfide reductase subunit B
LFSDNWGIRQKIAKTTSSRLENLVKFYSLYKKDPKTIYPDEIAYMRNSAKEIVQDCKEYNIDYKKELTPEMLKFYGIE